MRPMQLQQGRKSLRWSTMEPAMTWLSEAPMPTAVLIAPRVRNCKQFCRYILNLVQL
jgi:hypothetical protein